ncbi:MAG TPA: PP2C family protein-serine/threonine phosphatase [Mycobacteriales bacterium]|nr:PP2C family protein-serine/threonine phosphatase [Mycobacteriales bacterium]
MAVAVRTARWPLRLATLLTVAVALALTAGAVWATHLGARDQSRRLLKERTAEISLVLTQAIDAIPTSLQELGAVLDATDGDVPAFESAAQQQANASPTPITIAWLRQDSAGGYRVIAEAGAGDLRIGQVISDERVQTLDAAMATAAIVPTPVIGKDRLLGFALGSPAAPVGTVLYRQSTLGPAVAPPRAAGTAPFSELNVALYAARTADKASVLTSTTRDLPLPGEVHDDLLTVGNAKWLLTVSARSPLVGRLTADSPWIVLGIGVLGSLLVGFVVETVARRRDAAIALYEVEHHVAESLQRALLPTLPDLPGLQLAARYLASGAGQQVGGDWFDAFPVAGGRCGLVVGDVIGHDVAAASAMSQIRALLRGYAVDGDSPAAVLTRLERIIDELQLTQLVTVFYGLLEPPAADGSRALRYSNAGHVPPVLRRPDGTVEPLAGGASVVIGAPIPAEYAESEVRLPLGSTLALFTDGLVEVPGGSLTQGLDRVSQTVANLGEEPPEALCDDLLREVSLRSLRDDVALLVVRVLATSARSNVSGAPTSHASS